MRVRGRRCALILASALPLVANDVEPSTTLVAETSISVEPTEGEPANPILIEDENDSNDPVYTASQAIHDVTILRLPALPPQALLDTPAPSPESSQLLAESEESATAAATQSAGDDSDGDPPYSGEETEDEETESDDENDTLDDDKLEQDLSQDSEQNEEVDTEAAEAETEEISLSNETEAETQSSENSESLEENANITSSPGEAEEETESFDDDEEEDSLIALSVDYASKAAGALIIEKSNGFKGTSNLLNGDKDKYAIAPCEDRKFVVVSLSEDILVKQIKLLNFERFSSSVKDFQVLGSQILGTWFDMGTYSAKAGNGEQVFDLKEPAWARFLNFKFLSHHGHEFYCTYSQVKVHGSTMVQGFHEQWEEAQEENNLASETDKEPLTVEDDTVATNDQVNKTEAATEESNDEQTDLEDQGEIEEEEGDPPAETQPIDHSSTNDSDEKILEQVETSTEQEVIVMEVSVGGRFSLLSTSDDLHSKLNGKLSDEELFLSLYDMIPSTLNALHPISRDSPGRKTSGDLVGEVGSLRPRQGLTVPSKTSVAKPNGSEIDSDVISRAPDNVGDSIIEYLGTELGRMMMSSLATDLEEAEREAVPVRTEDVPSESEPMTNMEVPSANQSTEELHEIESENDNVHIDDGVNESSQIPPKTEEEEGEIETQEKIQEADDGAPKIASESNPAKEVDLTLVQLLKNLPSSECLTSLDLDAFKARVMEPRKPAAGGQANAAGSNPMEPIFKRLTDEIKALQSTLLAHEHFIQTSVACYQRVLLDLVLEMEHLRTDHEQRLLRLEQDWKQSQSSFSHILTQNLSALWGNMAVSNSALQHTLLFWSTIAYRFFVRLPGIVYRHGLYYWPRTKELLLSHQVGSDLAHKYFSPIIDDMDQRVVELQETNSIGWFEDNLFDEPNEGWHFPLIPILLLILVGRLIMCFAVSSPGKRQPQKRVSPSPNKLPSPIKAPVTPTIKGPSTPTETSDTPQMIDEQ